MELSGTDCWELIIGQELQMSAGVTTHRTLVSASQLPSSPTARQYINEPDKLTNVAFN